MKDYFADLHIHVGYSETGKWVKIPTSRQLTVRNILAEAAQRKGMQIIGIIDALSPLVLADLDKLIGEGILTLDGSGGYRYGSDLTLLLGAEIETTELAGGTAHTLLFMPDVATMRRFSLQMSRYIRNISMSSQNAHMGLARLVEIAAGYEAVIIPAHVFTPHKSLYGTCTDRMGRLLSDRLMQQIAAIELGLSSDSDMADQIAELADFTFVSNSDAHSPEKIAREYNRLRLAAPTYREFQMALRRREGRCVSYNYGLDPKLGKYHRTFCADCNRILPDQPAEERCCVYCGGKNVIKGVFERIRDIADYDRPRHPAHRPPYQYQIPLQFIPGVGKKTLEKLLSAFGTEMNVLHQANEREIAAVVGDKTADLILKARGGALMVAAGGGGIYGKIS